MRRRLATRSGRNAGACIIETKNVGGPTMNVTRSRSIRVSAVSGSQRAMNTVGNGTTPGKRDAVQQAGDVRAGRGHEHAVVDGPRPCACVHLRGLVRERGLRVQHAFRRAARARREQHGGQATRRRSTVRSTGSPSGSDVEVGDDERGLDRLEHARRRRPDPSGGAPARRRHQAASTRGTARATSSRFADCHATASPGPTPAAREPARDACDPFRRAPAPATRVSSTSSDGWSHGPPGAAVVRRRAVR